MCGGTAPGGWPPGPARLFKEEGHCGKSRQLADRVGLSENLNDQAGSLVLRGTARRLKLPALATEPRLLLLDEPAAGMNPQESLELMHFIGHIRDEFGSPSCSLSTI